MENNKISEVVTQAEKSTGRPEKAMSGKETWYSAEETKEKEITKTAEKASDEASKDPAEKSMSEASKEPAEKSMAEASKEPFEKTMSEAPKKRSEKERSKTSEGSWEKASAPKAAEKHAGRTGKDRKRGSWIFRGILVSAALAAAMVCMYGFFRDRAEEYKSSPMENYSNIAWLYRSCYMLYKDLYNAQTDEPRNYKELYMQPKEGYEWILEPDAWDEDSEAFLERFDSVEEAADGEISFYDLRNWVNYADSRFQELESEFSHLNSTYDYVIRDNTSGFYLTNMSESDLERGVSQQYFQIGFTFNEYGSVVVNEDVAGLNTAQIRKWANEAIRTNSAEDFFSDGNENFLYYSTINGPVNCTVEFRISIKDWEAGQGDAYRVTAAYSGWDYFPSGYGGISDKSAYRNAHMGVVLLLLLTIALFSGLIWPLPEKCRPWKEVKICSLPLEPLLAAGVVLFAGIGEWIFELMVYTASGRMSKTLYDLLGAFDFSDVLSVVVNLICLTVFFFCGWYFGICARAVKELGIKEYIKQKCIFYRIFPFIKSKILAFYDEVCHFDVTRNAHKIIMKIVLLNAVILFVISCFWVTGFPLTIVYSVILYVILRKYISNLQKKYGQLLHATNEIAQGNLNVKITEDLGVFEPFKPQIIRIQNGFKNAVEEETKSQRMKAELITNVSHDLKTPLTAIITYINLLKDANITEQQRKEYLDTLERKSLRLKVLIEDLFEVSKANSQTITLNIMDVDIMNLVKQVSFEMTDKLAASNLDVRMNLTDEKIILPLDSQKTYRIYENLLGNIAKYALPGTRVYINGFRIDDTVIITMKNISAQEITVDTAELTERFVRGDASRNTEGSGLGLAIAKSFMELQGGELSLEVDGDLFKATTTWHV